MSYPVVVEARAPRKFSAPTWTAHTPRGPIEMNAEDRRDYRVASSS